MSGVANSHAIIIVNSPQGVLNKVLYWEAQPRGPFPYHLHTIFGRKGTHFIAPRAKRASGAPWVNKSTPLFHPSLS